MTNKEILQADMLDILFEHRNKLYGAYALRKTYDNRLRLALGIALSIVLLFIMMSFINKNRGSGGVSTSYNDSIQLTAVNLKPDEPEPEKPKPEIKPVQAQADHQQIVIAPDDEATEIPDQQKISESIVSDANSEGEKATDVVQPVVASNGNGGDPVKSIEETPKVDLITRAPSFPGGTAAWLGFLQRYLQSPEDIEPGQRIEVQVRFLIDVDGSISNFVVVKSGGSAFDKEVIRALKKMPKWEPAMQNGNIIATPFTQPVIFIGVEQ